MDDSVLVERRGRVATLTFNRPDTRNAISTIEQIAVLIEALESLAHDSELSVAILTGAGTAFCSGGNVRNMKERIGFSAGGSVDLHRVYRHHIQRLILTLYDLELPTIAAVNGPAIGLGCDIACCCDLRMAAEGAIFAESFVKLSLIPGDGGAYFLQRLVGYAKAAEMSFTGEPIDAREALRIGLVSQIVPAAELMASAHALADRIAVNPPQALRYTKRLLRQGERSSLDAVFELSAALQAIVQRTDDHAEAVDAMLEKRPPRFTGR